MPPPRHRPLRPWRCPHRRPDDETRRLDFLVKPVAYPSLLDRLQQAIQHQDAAGAPPTIPPDIASRLTPREHDILLGLCSGKPSKRIAFELGISAKTVEHYRARLFQKFDAANAVELVRKIMTTTSHQ